MIPKILKIFIFLTLFVVAAGASTYLTLSLIIGSEETVVVPALKEKDVVYALQILSDLGLNTRIKASEYSATVPPNRVIDQEPAPGSEIKKGRNVRLVISRGQLAVPTPQLTGLPLSQALIVLEENGLCPGIRSHSNHAVYRAGAIIAQSPPSRELVNRHHCVDLLVSSGRYREAFAMADLTTLPVEDAILKIEAGNLKLGNLTETATPDVPLNTVAHQTPPAGYRVIAGQVVDLGVNRARSTGGRNGQASHGSWLVRYRTGSGFLNKHIKVRINSKSFSYDLYDGFMPPAQDLIFLVPRFENVAVMLYEDGELLKTIFPGSRLPDSQAFR